MIEEKQLLLDEIKEKLDASSALVVTRYIDSCQQTFASL